jgi:hypothetical protein
MLTFCSLKVVAEIGNKNIVFLSFSTSKQTYHSFLSRSFIIIVEQELIVAFHNAEIIIQIIALLPKITDVF